MTVVIGAQADNTNPDVYHISKSNLLNGISKEEFSAHADTLIYGTYQRSVNTQKGGALIKEYQAAFDGEQVDLDPASDCKTTHYIEIALTDSNIESFYFHWALSPKGLIQIKPSNKGQFIGKSWKLRSALFCNNDKYCSRCAGGLYSALKIEDAGLTCSQVGAIIQNISMKAFHDSTITTQRMDFFKYFVD
jgi:hypothetical protein